MFLFFNIGVLLLAFKIEPSLTYWVFASIFAIVLFFNSWIRFKRGMQVNLFRSGLLTLFIAIVINMTFTSFQPLPSFWLYLITISVFESFVELERMGII